MQLIKLSCSVGVLLALMASAATATDPYTLSPGGSVSAQSSTYPSAGTILQTSSSPFTVSLYSGTLTSTVRSGDTTNPYAGGLTFTYVLSLNASSSESVSSLAVSSFDSFLTDVSYNASSGGVIPGFFSRSSEGGSSGNVIHFSFLSPELGVGQSTAVLIVQTNATAFTTSSASIQDGVPATANALAPQAVPEPTIGGLLVGAMLAIGLVRRRSVAHPAA